VRRDLLLAVADPTKRGPDRLGQHLALGALALLVVALLGVLMRRAWQRRLRGQSDLPAPVPPPAVLPDDLVAPAAGLWVGSVFPDSWLHRVAAHRLGLRSAARLRVTGTGVLVERPAGDVWLPAGDLLGVAVEPALAGKVMGPGGIVVLRWTLAGNEIASGVRLSDRGRTRDVIEAVQRLLPAQPQPPLAVTAELTHPAAPAPQPVRPPAPAPDPLTAPLAALPPPPSPQPRSEPSPMSLVGRAAAPALLVLEDGRTFRGEAYGAEGESVGEAVFATGMTGYQETLTDPSYHRQVVVQTAPHIGNTGVNDEDDESARIWVAGYIVRDPSRVASSWRSRRSLDTQLRAQGIVGISGVDTRALTRHLRERGAMRCAVSSVQTDPDALLARVRRSPVMTGRELATEVSTTASYVVPPVGETRWRVTALDLGIKRRTPWSLARRGVETTVVPATTTAADILRDGPDGVFVSNGPGDPAATTYAHETVRGVLAAGVPVFGICMGNQVLGHALGLGTYKLGYGHRGLNSGRVLISSHNHGFAVAAPLQGSLDTPFGRVEVSHVGLNDQVVEGLRCLDVPAFSVQFHPEAAAGPHDASTLFDTFTRLMDGVRL